MRYITTAKFSHNKIQGDLFGGAGTVIAKYFVRSDGGGILQNDPSIDIKTLYEDRPILVSYEKEDDNSKPFFKLVKEHAVIVIACNDDMTMDDARAILNEKLPEKPSYISFNNYMDVCKALKLEVFKTAGEADAYCKALRTNFPDDYILLTTEQFHTILSYTENFTQIPEGKINFFPPQEDVIVKEPAPAYQDAIQKNILSADENADNYAGLYRYMFSDKNGINYFRNLINREYIKVAA